MNANVTLMKPSQVELDTKPFDLLVGEDIIQLIFQSAPAKVASRIAKALDHYTKAIRLQGVDDEMGAIRLIAAEEELVVAIFEWLKLKAKFLPDHSDFIGKYKNHFVKLAFYPVLSHLGFVLGDILLHGITIEGLEDAIHWRVKAVRHEDKIVLQIADNDGKFLMNVNPLDWAITQEERPADEVLDKLFADFKKLVADQHELTVRQFVTVRADFRNKLLYAGDGTTFSMDETLEQLTETVFSKSLRDLLWCIATLLTNTPTIRSWGLVSQFINLYRRALSESNLI